MEWGKLERRIEKNLKDILAQVEDSDKNKSWYSVLDKMYDTYTQKYCTGEDWHYWRKGDYLPKSRSYLPCIVCHQKPNCLEIPEPILVTFSWTGENQEKKKKQKKKSL